MNEQFEELMYESGLTAHGSWNAMDSYDQEAIAIFAKLIVQRCSYVADLYVRDCLCQEHKLCNHPKSKIGIKIKEYFGVDK